MRGAILLAALAAVPCAAQPVAVAPWVSGEDLVKLFPSVSASSRPLTALEQLHQYQAQAYINGVHDATEGKEWCYNTKYNPHQDELWAQVTWGLRALPADQLKRPASELIVTIWRKKWPCGRKP
jgi:hypothetical protein